MLSACALVHQQVALLPHKLPPSAGPRGLAAPFPHVPLLCPGGPARLVWRLLQPAMTATAECSRSEATGPRVSLVFTGGNRRRGEEHGTGALPSTRPQRGRSSRLCGMCLRDVKTMMKRSWKERVRARQRPPWRRCRAGPCPVLTPTRQGPGVSLHPLPTCPKFMLPHLGAQQRLCPELARSVLPTPFLAGPPSSCFTKRGGSRPPHWSWPRSVVVAGHVGGRNGTPVI